MRYTNRLWIWHREMLQQGEQLRREFQTLYFNFFTETVPLSKSCHYLKRELVFYGLWPIFLRFFFERYPFRCCLLIFCAGVMLMAGKAARAFVGSSISLGFSVTIVFKPSYINSSIFSSRHTGQHRGTFQDQENHTTQKTETGLLRSPGII